MSLNNTSLTNQPAPSMIEQRISFLENKMEIIVDQANLQNILIERQTKTIESLMNEIINIKNLQKTNVNKNENKDENEMENQSFLTIDQLSISTESEKEYDENIHNDIDHDINKEKANFSKNISFESCDEYRGQNKRINDTMNRNWHNQLYYENNFSLNRDRVMSKLISKMDILISKYNDTNERCLNYFEYFKRSNEKKEYNNGAKKQHYQKQQSNMYKRSDNGRGGTIGYNKTIKYQQKMNQNRRNIPQNGNQLQYNQRVNFTQKRMGNMAVNDKKARKGQIYSVANQQQYQQQYLRQNGTIPYYSNGQYQQIDHPIFQNEEYQVNIPYTNSNGFFRQY